jgi:hypothetical protein
MSVKRSDASIDEFLKGVPQDRRRRFDMNLRRLA